MLVGKDQPGNKPTLTLMELLDWCAVQNIPAIDVTGYYFPGTKDLKNYLSLKQLFQLIVQRKV